MSRSFKTQLIRGKLVKRRESRWNPASRNIRQMTRRMDSKERREADKQEIQNQLQMEEDHFFEEDRVSYFDHYGDHFDDYSIFEDFDFLEEVRLKNETFRHHFSRGFDPDYDDYPDFDITNGDKVMDWKTVNSQQVSLKNAAEFRMFFASKPLENSLRKLGEQYSRLMYQLRNFSDTINRKVDELDLWRPHDSECPCFSCEHIRESAPPTKEVRKKRVTKYRDRLKYKPVDIQG